MYKEELQEKVGKATYDKIYNARANAFNVHIDTNHHYDGKPYFIHLRDVFDNVLKYIDIFPAEDYQAILFGAAFHDSIEDARLTYNDVLKIAKKYMSADKALIATEIVYALTNEKGRTRAERANDKYYEGIRNTPYASFVKLGDRLANMKYSIKNGKKDSMGRKYLNELPHFLISITSTNNGIKYTIPEEMKDEILSL